MKLFIHCIKKYVYKKLGNDFPFFFRTFAFENHNN